MKKAISIPVILIIIFCASVGGCILKINSVQKVSDEVFKPLLVLYGGEVVVAEESKLVLVNKVLSRIREFDVGGEILSIAWTASGCELAGVYYKQDCFTKYDSEHLLAIIRTNAGNKIVDVIRVCKSDWSEAYLFWEKDTKSAKIVNSFYINDDKQLEKIMCLSEDGKHLQVYDLYGELILEKDFGQKVALCKFGDYGSNFRFVCYDGNNMFVYNNLKLERTISIPGGEIEKTFFVSTIARNVIDDTRAFMFYNGNSVYSIDLISGKIVWEKKHSLLKQCWPKAVEENHWMANEFFYNDTGIIAVSKKNGDVSYSINDPGLECIGIIDFSLGIQESFYLFGKQMGGRYTLKGYWMSDKGYTEIGFTPINGIIKNVRSYSARATNSKITLFTNEGIYTTNVRLIRGNKDSHNFWWP
ncbi:MAG TPA: hypothetical protein PLX04_05205 [Caldisericia bacterium]|nr:hypothetical protein [Caldisericia bacterium]HPL89625.1 hypothetical protein [Caldisericia bacterium]HQG60200.1 hypothetical protein [Caldisericia bacterium]HQH48584.1 hypothetical protein [Caldisericia bacterium]HQJ44516.1 hypothetical protein [Caldisericia bacterium]